MPRTDPGEAAVLDRIAVHAPAKINLALHVAGRRADGYHLLESLVVFSRLGDELEVLLSRADRFTIGGPFADLIPTGSDNLVLRARDAFRQRHGDIGPVSIRLTKNLPPASGIGGGSSDAAACLVALAELGGSVADLAATGATLGADVPMCLDAQPLIARGIGDEIDRVDAFPALSLVLVNPRIDVPTPAIFKRLPSPDNSPLPARRPFGTSDDVIDWLASTRNDLQAPAIGYAPPIANVLDALDASGARLTRMSGSGATCFGIFRDDGEAARAAEHLRAAHPSWFVAATTSFAAGAFEGRIKR